MNAVIDLLISKLSSSGTSAEHAADALIDQASRKGTEMDVYVPQLARHLRHSNFDVRAAVSKALGYIGTNRAVDTLMQELKYTPPNELQKMCRFSCNASEPLCYWFIRPLS